jgi:hypothetical protein
VNIYQKLLKIKEAVPYLKKNKVGFNFNYADPESVLETFNPLFNEQKIIIIPRITRSETIEIDKENEKGKKSVEFLYITGIEYELIDTEDPAQSIKIPWLGSGCNNEEQGLGSSLTYGLRYFLLGLFQVPTGKDDPDAKQRGQKAATEKPAGNQPETSEQRRMRYHKDITTRYAGNKPLFDAYTLELKFLGGDFGKISMEDAETLHCKYGVK